jgi:hypothetical protein
MCYSCMWYSHMVCVGVGARPQPLTLPIIQPFNLKYKFSTLYNKLQCGWAGSSVLLKHSPPRLEVTGSTCRKSKIFPNNGSNGGVPHGILGLGHVAPLHLPTNYHVLEHDSTTFYPTCFPSQHLLYLPLNCTVI